MEEEGAFHVGDLARRLDGLDDSFMTHERLVAAVVLEVEDAARGQDPEGEPIRLRPVAVGGVCEELRRRRPSSSPSGSGSGTMFGPAGFAARVKTRPK